MASERFRMVVYSYPGVGNTLVSLPDDQSGGVFPGGSDNGRSERDPGGPIGPPETTVTLNRLCVLILGCLHNVPS